MHNPNEALLRRRSIAILGACAGFQKLNARTLELLGMHIDIVVLHE